MESKVFTAELDEKLIDMVRDHPVLYSFTHKNYKNNGIKENVWQLISVALGITINECKMRWRTIRDSYKKNLNKIKANSTTGSAAFPKSKYLNKNLQFLDVTFKGGKVTSSFQSTVPLTAAAADDRSSASHTGTPVRRADNDADEASDGDLLELPEGTEEVGESEMNELNATNDEPEKKRRKITAKEKMIQEIKSGREERNVILKDLLSAQKTASAPVNVPEHAIDIFFKSMSEVVKTLPRHLQAETRLKVCQLVTEMEIKALAEGALDIPQTVPSNHVMAGYPHCNH